MRATAVALGALAVAGCAVTTYRPVEPRPVWAGRAGRRRFYSAAPAHEAELAIRVQQPTLIGPVTLSTADKESCSAPGVLPVGYRTEGSDFSRIDDAFEVNRAEVVFVELPSGAEIAAPGLFLDVKVDTASEQGCLRAPLTASGAERCGAPSACRGR